MKNDNLVIIKLCLMAIAIFAMFAIGPLASIAESLKVLSGR